MADLVVAGKVRALGLSEVSVAELDRAQAELELSTADLAELDAMPAAIGSRY